MKRKPILVIVFISLCTIAAAIYLLTYFTPRPVLHNPETAKLQNIRHHGAVESLALDANQVKAVMNLLSQYQCRRTMKSYFPFHGENADYELVLHTDTEYPWIILIGKINICYISSDQRATVFEILEAQNLSAELKGIVG